MPHSKTPKLFYILIVLACMNFLGRGSIVFLLLSLYELFRRKSYVAIDGNAIVIGCFSLCVIFAAAVYYSYTECIKAANYLLLYLLGFDGFRRTNDKEKYIEHTALAICCGFGLELVLMYVYNYNREQLSVRSMYSVWSGETISVTLLGLLGSAVIGFSFYAFFYSRKKGMKILVLVMLVIGLMIGVDTATRTPVLLLGIVYVIMLTIHLFNKRGAKALKFVGLGMVVLVLAVVVYQLNIGGVKTAIWDTPLFRRFLAEEFSNGRGTRFWEHLALMLDHPWGGSHIEDIVGKGAHNYLQQGHDLYGIFAFAFLLAITVQFLSNIMKLLRKQYKTGTDMLFLSMYFSMWIQMCLEPIFTGYPILFWSLLIIHGMATAYLKDERRSNMMRNKGKL